jgi:hypothetical protein
MFCRNCGIEAATREVDFRQTVGLIVVRLERRVSGQLCKRCIHRKYWRYLITNVLMGPWSITSFFYAPYYVVKNTTQYARCLSMPGVPWSLSRPELTDEVIEKIEPLLDGIQAELDAGGDVDEAYAAAAERAGVRIGEIAICMHAAKPAS